MPTNQKSITAFKIIQFWLITLSISTILHFIFMSLLDYGILLVYLESLPRIFITSLAIYSPVLIALLIVNVISSNQPLKIKSKRLTVTFMIAFVIVYACTCCWIYFDIYDDETVRNPLVPDYFYRKIFIDLIIRYSVTALIYVGTTILAWIFISRRMRKWNSYVPDQNKHLLDQ